MGQDIELSAVVGTYNRLDYLKATIETLRSDITTIQSEIIVVDGGSTDGTIAWLAKQKDVITILQHNRGTWNNEPIQRRSWGYFMNLGFRAASGKYICMLSDDCLVIPGAITNGLRHIEAMRKKNKKIGMSAFYWRNWPEQESYWVGITFGDRMFVNHGLYLREALEKVHYIDAENYSFYHADGDLALRIWEAGYICIDSPNSHIEHYSDANIEVRNSNLIRQHEDWNIYTKRWKKLGNPKTDWVEKSFNDQDQTAIKYWKPKHRFLKRRGI